jgi:pimeloyl-ACP methyl ester carboxylesterase
MSPVEIHYREWGAGEPMVFLHGGWGYEVYPFDRQIEAFGGRFRIIAPDRSGYGRSARLEEHPQDFHRHAAFETLAVLDALRIERAVLWGHSDGAVIAAIMGLAAPSRFRGLILEAAHYDRAKPASREFFEGMVLNPDGLGDRITTVLANDHASDYWRTVLRANGLAWLRIAEQSDLPEKDLYSGRLSELAVPAIFIHGSRDPRTEPGELVAIHRRLPGVPIRVIEDAGHSPHSASGSAAECTALADEFLSRLEKKAS